MKAFVIHAERLKERAEHIDRMLSEEGIEYEFVNEGNDDEKIQGYLDKYMKDGRELLHRKVPRSLCTISHFLAYERILAGNMDGALVLEDDIVLHKRFLPRYKKSISEYSKNYTERPVLISYEDSPLQFVPRSRRGKGKCCIRLIMGACLGLTLLTVGLLRLSLTNCKRTVVTWQ